MINKIIADKKLICICAVLVFSLCVMPISAKSKKVRLSRTSITMEVGSKTTLKVKNISKKAKVKWKSSRKKVAAVSKNGLVKAKKTGSAKITAKVGKNIYKCSVKVIPVGKVTKDKNVITAADSNANNTNSTNPSGNNTVNMNDLLNPDGSSKPKATEKPRATTKPVATKKPATTTKPTSTTKPAVTEKPKTTEKPAATKKPATNVDPGIADAPVMDPDTRDDGWIPGWY